MIEQWLRVRWMRQMFSSLEGRQFFLSLCYWNESFPQRHPEKMPLQLISQIEIQQMVFHALEEEKEHARLFAERLKAVDMQPIDLPPELRFVEQIFSSSLMPSGTRIQDGYPFSSEELIRYLAGCVCIERLAIDQFKAALCACRLVGVHDIAVTIEHILAEEAEHADSGTAGWDAVPPELRLSVQQMERQLETQASSIDRRVASQGISYGLTQSWGPRSPLTRAVWRVIAFAAK